MAAVGKRPTGKSGGKADGPAASASPQFGEAVRLRRARAGMTQEELARLAGLSVRALRYIERGQVHRPRAGSVRRLAAVFGLDPDDWAEPRPAHLAILGPLELRLGGRPADPGPRKQQCLLALLALKAGEVVGTGEIIDALWGDDPPASCHNLVHTHVARLRKILGADAGAPGIELRTVGGGYRLVAGVDQLDAFRFGALAEQAARERGTAAGETLARALGCWRGPVLAGLPAGIRRHPAAVALAQRRIWAVMALADRELEGNGAPRSLAALRELAAEEPLHEGLHARLLLVLAGTGQQAEAVRLYGDVRARLVRELGIEPGAELRTAHQRVLRQEVRTGRG
ncbi:BTAD domain-containing putative transcriptional regulator [Amycolatopsis sp. NPDC059090]|uniref:BTAD domain-containing putative transcriptional regulator n=1 Tax=unclassified Amycolatopsis TaxID=2618356 RepID=UPI00366AC569